MTMLMHLVMLPLVGHAKMKKWEMGNEETMKWLAKGRRHISLHFRKLLTVLAVLRQSSYGMKKSMSIHTARCTFFLQLVSSTLKVVESVNCTYFSNFVKDRCIVICLIYTSWLILQKLLKVNSVVRVNKMPVCAHSLVHSCTSSVEIR